MKTAISVLLMVLFAGIGFLAGALCNDPMGGAALFALITGIACIIHTIDNKR